jgi:hypothetical protein
MAGLLPLRQQALESDSLELRGRPFVGDASGIQSHSCFDEHDFPHANYKVWIISVTA